jgi:hypothetical protein
MLTVYEVYPAYTYLQSLREPHAIVKVIESPADVVGISRRTAQAAFGKLTLTL